MTRFLLPYVEESFLFTYILDVDDFNSETEDDDDIYVAYDEGPLTPAPLGDGRRGHDRDEVILILMAFMQADEDESQRKMQQV